MVKSKAAAERKMKDRVSGAGTYLKEGMEEAPNPLDVILKDPEGHLKKMEDGLREANRTGKTIAGIKTAQARDSWTKGIPRAAAHYEERAEDMTAHAMEDYDVRAGCIEKAKGTIDKMPKATRAQRIARSSKYQDEMGKCMDAAKGRKA